MNISYESFVNYVYEKLGVLDLFTKKGREEFKSEINSSIYRIKRPTPRWLIYRHDTPHTKECENIESIISKKTVVYLDEYTKVHKFDQKYKTAVGSYPSMDITYHPDGNIVQLSTDILGINYNIPKWLEEKTKSCKTVGDLKQRFPVEYSTKWLEELIDAGKKYINSFNVDGYYIDCEYNKG